MSGEDAKIPKIVIPKIVLKFGGAASKPEVRSDSIYSPKAAEFVAANDVIVRRIPSIPFTVLLKKTNQSIYRSIENIIELMGRMGDVERKKTLFQVLQRARALYARLHLLSLWEPARSSHLAIKVLILQARDTLQRLAEQEGNLRNCGAKASFFLAPRERFSLLKGLYSISLTCPEFFAPPIAGLSILTSSNALVGKEECWTSSLESLLVLEVTKSMQNSTSVQPLSIEQSKCRIKVHQVFEFELTLVPSAGEPAWFVLSAHGSESFKNLFRNGLTGIFQARYNNRTCSSIDLFASLERDCKLYIDLFYFEKLFSEISFLSTRHGRSNVSFYHEAGSKTFQFTPWFLKEPVSVAFSPVSGFEVSSQYRHIFTPTLNFSESVGESIFEQLFAFAYGPKLNTLFAGLSTRNLIYSYQQEGNVRISVNLIEGFSMVLCFNVLEKKASIKLLGFESDAFEANFEKGFLGCDLQATSTALARILQDAYKQILCQDADFKVLDCSGTGIVLFSPIKRVSLRLVCSADGESFLNLVRPEMVLEKGIGCLKLKEDHIHTLPLIHDKKHLFAAIEAFINGQVKDSSQSELQKFITTCRIEGSFLDERKFRPASFGLPGIVDDLLIVDDGSLSLFISSMSKEYSLVLDSPNTIVSAIRIFWLLEHLQSLERECSLNARLDLSFGTTKICLGRSGNLECKDAELARLLNYPVFDIYRILKAVE